MDLVCKKTTELSPAELQAIVTLFNKVFRQERTLSILLNQYTQNAFGTSYHTLMYDDGILVGHVAGLPGYYWIHNKKLKAVNPIDLMIEEGHRGLQGFLFLIKKAWNYYREQGVQIIYHLPNNHSHPLFIQLKCSRSIGNLYTYALPYRIGGVVPRMKLFNFLSKAFCRAWVLLPRLFGSNRPIDFGVRRDYDSFMPSRYNRLDGNYSFGEVKDTKFAYKIMTYEGKRAAFLIDVLGKSQKAFCRAVHYLLKNESKHFDLILYVGYLPFFNPGLIRIPHRFEPKNFHFDGLLLDENGLTEEDKEAFYDIDHWDINLSDDDII